MLLKLMNQMLNGNFFFSSSVNLLPESNLLDIYDIPYLLLNLLYQHLVDQISKAPTLVH